jgi:hypothetical protein
MRPALTTPARAPAYEVARRPLGWLVVTGAGVPASPVFARRDQAESLAARLAARAGLRKRVCLHCGWLFLSSCFGERLCRPCVVQMGLSTSVVHGTRRRSAAPRERA